MILYIALLRGINVGGKNIIKMAELKNLFENIGFYDVKTYIQSGNVLFKSNDEENNIRNKIEHDIKECFGFSVKVVLRTAKELEAIIKNCPFTNDEVHEAESLNETECQYISFLEHEPSKENIESLNAYRSESDNFRILGKDLYLLFHHSIRNSKLANNINKLNVQSTVRNWKTVNKLFAIAKAMENTL